MTPVASSCAPSASSDIRSITTLPSFTVNDEVKCAHIGSYCWMSSVPPDHFMVPR